MRKEEIIDKLQGDLEDLRMAEDQERINAPDQVEFALRALKVVYRSLRLTQKSKSSVTGSEDYAGKEEKHEYTTLCRPLSRAEREMRDAACKCIQDFLSTYPDDEVPSALEE